MAIEKHKNDIMSLIRIDKIYQDLKLEGILRYFCMAPSSSFKDNLKVLGSDHDVMSTCYGREEVYDEHLTIDDLKKEFQREAMKCKRMLF